MIYSVDLSLPHLKQPTFASHANKICPPKHDSNQRHLVENIPVFDWHHQVVFGVPELCFQDD